MIVELIAHTNNAEKIVSAAAKTCYSSVAPSEILDNLDDEKTSKFIDMLMDLGHTSTIEHVSFTFSIEGVSRSLLAQFTRHRIASFSVRSQRYVSEKGFEFVVPPAILKNEKAQEIYLKAMQDDVDTYNKLADALYEDAYNELLEQGVDEKKAKGIAKKRAIEDARYVLPNSCKTNLVATFNARSLYNFFELRCCERAQWEIRELAFEMYKLVREVAPTLFSKAGPSCVYGACGEGNMTCGKASLVREKYRNC
ncbi:MAG: FAD-dependent thymidylate synthase [Clostridia bacterium]